MKPKDTEKLLELLKKSGSIDAIPLHRLQKVPNFRSHFVISFYLLRIRGSRQERRCSAFALECS